VPTERCADGSGRANARDRELSLTKVCGVGCGMGRVSNVITSFAARHTIQEEYSNVVSFQKR